MARTGTSCAQDTPNGTRRGRVEPSLLGLLGVKGLASLDSLLGATAGLRGRINIPEMVVSPVSSAASLGCAWQTVVLGLRLRQLLG